jgi:hypothetical protein
MRGFFHLAAIGFAAFLAACAQPALAPGIYEVDPARAALFKNGPAQGTGPDVSLSKGDRVEVLASERGFSRVRLVDGREGYVSSQALRAVRGPTVGKAAPVRPRVKSAAPAVGGGGPGTTEDILGVPPAAEETPRPRFRF